MDHDEIGDSLFQDFSDDEDEDISDDSDSSALVDDEDDDDDDEPSPNLNNLKQQIEKNKKDQAGFYFDNLSRITQKYLDTNHSDNDDAEDEEGGKVIDFSTFGMTESQKNKHSPLPASSSSEDTGPIVDIAKFQNIYSVPRENLPTKRSSSAPKQSPSSITAIHKENKIIPKKAIKNQKIAQTAFGPVKKRFKILQETHQITTVSSPFDFGDFFQQYQQQLRVMDESSCDSRIHLNDYMNKINKLECWKNLDYQKQCLKELLNILVGFKEMPHDPQVIVEKNQIYFRLMKKICETFGSDNSLVTVLKRHFVIVRFDHLKCPDFEFFLTSDHSDKMSIYDSLKNVDHEILEYSKLIVAFIVEYYQQLQNDNIEY